MAAQAAQTASRIEVKVKNNAPIMRSGESVRMDWSAVTAKLNVDAKNVVVTDSKGAVIPSQVLFEGKDTPQGLLFQADVAANGSAIYYIAAGEQQEFPARAYGRYVPERIDDYAWENDLIAYRIYGPRLTDPLTPGIDIWVKSTNNLIINKWYKKGDGKGGYHHNDGEGMDCFKVGNSLGCGAASPLIDGKLVLGGNYVTWQTLDNGPIRTSFKTTYGPFDAGGKQVSMQRVISLDAGDRFNTVRTSFSGDFKKMTVAVGLVMHTVEHEGGGNSSITIREQASDSKDPAKDGDIYMGAIWPSAQKQHADNHLLLTREVASGQEFTYRAGAGWSQGGILNDRMWDEMVRQEEIRMQNPLKVSLKAIK